MIRLGSRHFAATLAPRGIHLIEYRRGVRRLHVVDYVHDSTPLSSPADLSARLGSLLDERGAAGARLSVAINGFGTYYQIMALPAAPPEVLRPVVMRELRHVYPDLKDALVAFGRTRLELEAKQKGRQQGPREREIQLLVGVVPRDVVSLLHETLGNRNVLLEHVTILPRAVQQVYEAYARSEETLALALASTDAPLLGFFNREGLQFFTSPPGAAPTEEGLDVQPMVEQIERGALFLRQQFRGQRLDRVLLVADEATAEYQAALQQRGYGRVEGIGPEGLAPGALAGLGVALDARSGSMLNVLPAPMRPPAEADPWILQLTLVSAVVLVLASAWWGWSGVRAAHDMEERVSATSAELQRRSGPLASIREVVRERQLHQNRVDLLLPLEQSRRQLQEILWAMEVAPSAIRLDSLRVAQVEDRWDGMVAGSAVAARSAEAARAVNDWYRGMGRGQPADAYQLQNLFNVAPDSTAGAAWEPTRVQFRVGLRVPIDKERE